MLRQLVFSVYHFIAGAASILTSFSSKPAVGLNNHTAYHRTIAHRRAQLTKIGIQDAVARGVSERSAGQITMAVFCLTTLLAIAGVSWWQEFNNFVLSLSCILPLSMLLIASVLEKLLRPYVLSTPLNTRR